MTKTLHLILGNCLFSNIESLHIKDGDCIVMIEDRDLCTHFTYHKHKIILFLAAMRNYRDELEQQLQQQKISASIEYIQIENNQKIYTENLQEIISTYNISTIQTYDIEDYFFNKIIQDFCRKENIELTILPSQGFLTSHVEFKLYTESYKRLFMNDFYQWQRKRLDILVDENRQPIGGKWSFDEENRKKLPKNITLPKDPILSIEESQNPHLKDVISVVDSLFSNHPGESSNFWIPTTRAEALNHFEKFLEERFSNFGPYEDAIEKSETFLFHSILSPIINCGLLTPKEIIDKTLEYYEKNQIQDSIQFSSIEGFIRQIIGWREFVRGCYHHIKYEEKEEEDENSLNYLNHQRKLSRHFYEGTTGIEPLDDTIKKVIKYAYCHHIERLMVIGNSMILCEIHPKEVYKWFMELFVDSSDWVMAPNVYSMSQFSDGGISTIGFATKPYIAGSNYICKMSNYSKGEEWCDIVDGLYWRFIDKNRKLFLKNPRMGMMVKLLDKMNKDKKSKLFSLADTFLKSKLS